MRKILYTILLLASTILIVLLFCYCLYIANISPIDNFFAFCSVIAIPLLVFLTAFWILEKYILKTSKTVIELNTNTTEEIINDVEVQENNEGPDENEYQELITNNNLPEEVQSENKKINNQPIVVDTEIIVENKADYNIQVEPLEIKSNTEISQPLITNTQKEFVAKKVDWEKVNQLRSDIGKVGEEIAVQYLKTIYKEVKHASLAFDGLGYDIELIDSENQVFYAEVKTTTQNFGQNIFISQNEVDFMNNHPEKFILCIVHNLDVQNKDAKIKILTGKDEISDFFDFEAQSFSISFK